MTPLEPLADGVGHDEMPLWSPSPERVERSALDRFRLQVAEVHGVTPATSRELHAWSVAAADDFWEMVFRAAVHRGSRGGGPVSELVDRPPGRSYFPTAAVCYAEELLAGGSLPGADDVALVYRREDGHREEHSWEGLRREVAACAWLLRTAGVGSGDRVAAWLPNVPEAVIAMLAANSLGAVFTSASPDFGPSGLADRFAQVAPSVLIVADAYHYDGKVHGRLSALPEVLRLLPTVTTVVVVPEVESRAAVAEKVAALDLGRNVAVALWPLIDGQPREPEFTRRGYSDPGFVLYSSGTTGQPKCIVHSALGLALKHWTEHVLHSDIRAGDTVFYFTTCGWMMWNWLVASLAVGATVVLYDGSPLHDDGQVLWSLAAAERVTFFGASAKFFDSCRQAGLRPAAEHDLSHLRTVASTGSPLSAEDFAYVYADVAPDAQLASISGGTDICGCFVLGDPTRPVYAGEIQTPALGVAVDVVDEAGESLAARPGERGELICRNTFPSMPLGFWGDVDGSRYRAAYFDANPGVWTHGDFAHWTDHGGIVITGRSDATLNAGGVRIGTAEIYRQVESFDEVVEALAVGQEYDGDTRIVLFLRMAPGAALDEDLAARIRRRLRSHASPRHVPAVILAVADLPRTRSGKLAELAVADVVNGRPVRNTHALANPECLTVFEDLPDLAR